MKHQEHIVAVPAGLAANAVNGLVKVEIENKDIIIAQRAMLETNELYRQLLPIAVLQNDGKIWAYRRTPKGGEKRLHGKIAVAVGGHWDMEDVEFEKSWSVINLEASMQAASKREMEEEIKMVSKVTKITEHPLKIAASETEVDRVHMAVPFFFELDGQDISPKEDQLESVGWFTPKELLESDMELETWTVKICEILLSTVTEESTDV